MLIMYSFNTEIQWHVEEPYTDTRTWHPLLMRLTKFVAHWCGMGSYNLTSTCHKSANVVNGHSRMNGLSTLIPHMFSGVRVKTAGFHSPLPNSGGSLWQTCSVRANILEDSFLFQTVELYDCQWLFTVANNQVPIRHSAAQPTSTHNAFVWKQTGYVSCGVQFITLKHWYIK